MEKEGVRQGLCNLEANGVQVKELVTDGHLGIKSMMSKKSCCRFIINLVYNVKEKLYTLLVLVCATV